MGQGCGKLFVKLTCDTWHSQIRLCVSTGTWWETHFCLVRNTVAQKVLKSSCLIAGDCVSVAPENCHAGCSLLALLPLAQSEAIQTNLVSEEWFCFLLADWINNRTAERFQALERFSQRFSWKADTNSWRFTLPTAIRPAKLLPGAVKTQTHRIGCAVIMTSAFRWL